MKKWTWTILPLLLLVLPAVGQTLTDPQRVNWPKLTGNGAPTLTCASANYGRHYLDKTANHEYVCDVTGWHFTDAAALAAAATAQSTANTAITLASTGGGSGGSTVAVTNIDDSLTNWSTCIKPGCDPGGTGTPTATSQTINNASPAKDAGSMLISQTATANSTNALWVYKASACDSCTVLTSDYWVYLGSNSSHVAQFEYDLGIFSSSTGIEFMWGMQWNQATNKWQIFNQNANTWVDTSLTTALSYSTWHHIQVVDHRVQGDTSNCSGMPCMYYDSITIDGTTTNWNLVEPAGVLPTGWASVTLIQFQMNQATVTGSTTVTENLDQVNFTASQVSYPPAGIAVSTGLGSWGTSLTAPTGVVVGTSDTQTLTNKSIDGAEINSGTLPAARIPAQYKTKQCPAGYGDGQNQIPTGTYVLNYLCENISGVTYTITGIHCHTDNTGTTTANVVDSSNNNLLTGAITATPAGAAGTQTSTTTLANGAWTKWTFSFDGTTKQIQCYIAETF